MSDPSLIELPARRAVCVRYAGPRSGLGGATRTVYGWVGTYFPNRIGDVTIQFSKRPKPDHVFAPTEPIHATIVFEIDDVVPEQAVLPDSMTLETLMPESLITTRYGGPLTALHETSLPWMESMTKRYALQPGYRQRMVEMKSTPTDPGWEVEVQLLRKPE